MSGVVLTGPARTVDPSRTAAAIGSLTAAVSGYPEGMTRSRAFSLMALAANHLLDGDFDHAADVGARAPALAGTIRSTRVADRLRPLRRLAGRHPGNVHARAPSAGIAAFTPPN
ncbi:hypothetical protein [Saccharothrix texasensis]|uniref:hypothetical protein n=1 Tax=Saccharothrix texasensis TaxID=103734 RepID=UPI000F4CADF0|nr:hypothetical protein [Saccharothrix texasensis]